MAKINKELVFKLADELKIEGKNVTNLAIRERNDNKGSLTSISPLLKEWKQLQRDREDEENSMPIDLLIQTLEPLWTVLKKQAHLEFNNKVKDIETTNQNELSILFAAFDDQEKQSEILTEEIEKLKTSLKEANNLINQQNATIEEKNQLLDNLQEQTLKANNDIAALTKQMANQTKTINRLEKHNTSITNLLDHKEKDNVLLTQNINDQKSINTQLEDAINQLEEKVRTEQTENQQSLRVIQTKNEENQNLSHKITEQKDKISQLKFKLELEKENLFKKEIQVSEANNQKKTIADLLESKKDEVGSLVIENEQIKRDNADLRANIIELTKLHTKK